VLDAIVAALDALPARDTATVRKVRRQFSRDTQRTIRICTALRADRERMVRKALSWALRVLAKRDPAAVRAFLAARDP
jgi:3-methyladenine DNA glycosylase AlkD